MSNFGFFDPLKGLSRKISAGEGQIERVHQGIKSARRGLTRAQITAQRFQLGPEHWRKIDDAERNFDAALAKMDRIFPEKFRGFGKRAEKTMGILALMGALALIGSTALVYVLANRPDQAKPPRRPKPEPEEEYEYED